MTFEHYCSLFAKLGQLYTDNEQLYAKHNTTKYALVIFDNAKRYAVPEEDAKILMEMTR